VEVVDLRGCLSGACPIFMWWYTILLSSLRRAANVYHAGRRKGRLKAECRRDRLHVVEILEATVGGTRTHILHLLEGLSARGFRMTLIASAERNARFRKDMKRMTEAGVQVIEVPMVRRIAPWRDLTCLFRLWSALRSLEADIVHAHASKAGMLGRIAARLAGVRNVVHTPHVYYFQGKRGIGRRFFRMLERLALPLAAKTVLLSEGQGKLATNELGAAADRVVVIENGVDTSHFSPQGRKREARETLGVRPDAPTIGTITRLRPQKGCDLFLQAMVGVFSEMPECNCILVGEGPLRAPMKRLAQTLGIAERILWREHSDDPREIYEALDLFVISSRYEGMPYVLLEAMSMGLPVVATRIPGCQEVIKEGATGLLAAPGDPEDLVRQILALLRHPERAQRMGTAARHAVSRDFPHQRFLERTAELYLVMGRQ